LKVDAAAIVLESHGVHIIGRRPLLRQFAAPRAHEAPISLVASSSLFDGMSHAVRLAGLLLIAAVLAPPGAAFTSVRSQALEA
jgi:hypothetical protein